MLLARPLSRRRLYLTLLVATVLFVAVAMAAQVARHAHRIDARAARSASSSPSVSRLMWLNGVLVFAAFGSVALAASVSFDRLTPGARR